MKTGTLKNILKCLMLYDLEEREESIPVPISINDVVTENGDIVSLVACDT